MMSSLCVGLLCLCFEFIGAKFIGNGNKLVNNLSNGALRLRNVQELIYSSSEWKAQLDEESTAIFNGLIPLIEEKKGRPCVDEAMKKVQRLQLQLDRSDGRTDITPDMISNIYFDFMSTCLRTEGGAWVAPLGPLQYVGFFLENFITVEETRRSIDVAAIADRMGQVLIDAPSLSDESLDAQATITRLTEDVEAKLAIQDFLLTLLRTAVRFASLKDELEGTPPVRDFSIALLWPDESSHLCSLEKLDVCFALSCDFGECDDNMIISEVAVKRWIEKNALR